MRSTTRRRLGIGSAALAVLLSGCAGRSASCEESGTCASQEKDAAIDVTQTTATNLPGVVDASLKPGRVDAEVAVRADAQGEPDQAAPPPKCTEGETKSCGEALGAKGACKEGKTLCHNNEWGACSIAPAASDKCEVAHDDSNCNGFENDTCPCTIGDTGSCGVKLGAQGACKEGTATCNADGKGWTCSIQPMDDTCDATNDNNCDNIYHNPQTPCECVNGNSVECGCGGLKTCVNGKYGACSAPMKTFYLDSDNDHFGDPAHSVEACAAPAHYVEDSRDCCDSDDLVNPNQTLPSGSKNKCGTYDYNCDGHEVAVPIGPTSCGTGDLCQMVNGKCGLGPGCSECGGSCITYSVPACGADVTFFNPVCTWVGGPCGGGQSGSMHTAQPCL